MRCLIQLLLLMSALAVGPVVAQPQATAPPAGGEAERVIEQLNEPMYTPFIERYMLDELRQLRIDLSNQRVDLTQQILDRDLGVADKAISYSSNTVTYFFYLIAAVSSVLVIVGWTSIRDIRDKVHSAADKEVQRLVDAYEDRLRGIEKQLTQKSQRIDQNREAIERNQEVHALWLRAAQEHSGHARIALYDEILKLRPADSEAITYKADAALELGEPQWAKNLCHQALEKDPEYGHAHYQLACANVALGNYDEAVSGIARALTLSESIAEDVLHDPALESLRQYPAFKELMETRALKASAAVASQHPVKPSRL